MFPPRLPSQTQWVYPGSKFDNGAVVSLVNPFSYHSDTAAQKAYPDYARVQPIFVTLEAGDAMYIPRGWFHYAEALTAGVSLTGRAVTPCEVLMLAPILGQYVLHHMGLYKAGDCTCHN